MNEINKITDENKLRKKQLLFNESILLAIVPILGYSFAFAYEFGYCRFFEIPSEFINLDFKRVFGASLMMIVLFVLLLAIFNFLVFLLIMVKDKPYEKAIIGTVPFILIGLPVVLLTGSLTFAIFLIVFVFIIIIFSLSPAFYRKFVEKDNRDLNILISEESVDIHDRLKRTRPTDDILSNIKAGIFMLFLVFGLVITTGHFMARNETEFWVFDDNDSKIVTRIYGEYLAIKTINRTNKKLLHGVELIKFPSDGIRIHKSSIGPMAYID